MLPTPARAQKPIRLPGSCEGWQRSVRISLGQLFGRGILFFYFWMDILAKGWDGLIMG